MTPGSRFRSAVASERPGGVPLLAWALVLAPFFVDATATLLRRVARGERWYAAHRSHAYQRAVQAGHSHARVSAAVMAIAAAQVPLAFVVVLAPRAAVAAAAVGAALAVGAYLLVERIRPMAPP